MPGYARDPLYDSDDVLIYTNSTQRSTLLPSPTVGVLTYLTETDVYEYWDGTAWSIIVDTSSFATTSSLQSIQDDFIDPYFLMGA